MSYIDSWKNKEVSEMQLELNKEEIEGRYPEHWHHFLVGMKLFDKQPAHILDVGCGVGVFCELLHKECPDMKYTGLDYSEEAIALAKKTWEGKGLWLVGSYEDIQWKDALNYDLVHLGALLDVLPNGDEALNHILRYGFKNLIIGRMKLTDGPSKKEVYTAYDRIKTYAYTHNYKNVIKQVEDFGYNYVCLGRKDSCTLILSKNLLSLESPSSPETN
jgi:ubiquinone/menaquinone biosynthesis C-methylase UbiE